MKSELLLKGRQRSWEFCCSVEGNGAGIVSVPHPHGGLVTSLCKNYWGWFGSPTLQLRMVMSPTCKAVIVQDGSK